MSGPQSAASLLRAEFDASFAEAPPEQAEGVQDLLAIRIGGDPYALRMADISRLAAGCGPVPWPTHAAAFSGLVGLRGEILPLWDLASLLGYAPTGRHTRWLAASNEAPHWAAAFEHFEATVKAPRRELSPYSGAGPGLGFADQLCSTGGILRPVLNFQKLSQSIRQGAFR
jgi:chemotaxis signal transduction protein